jgi:uncharacterized membrane protein (UPF0127 family)
MGNMFKISLIVKVVFYIILSLSAMAFISACRHQDQMISMDNKKLPIRIDGKLDFVRLDGSVLASIFIEIADTVHTQTKGLMGRNALGPNYGMLFVFENIQVRRFRMFNTRVPLDIIFIDENGCICNIARNAAPLSKRTYQSSGPIKYVVEVQGNYTQRFKIDKDTCIRWQRF